MSPHCKLVHALVLSRPIGKPGNTITPTVPDFELTIHWCGILIATISVTGCPVDDGRGNTIGLMHVLSANITSN